MTAAPLHVPPTSCVESVVYPGEVFMAAISSCNMSSCTRLGSVDSSLTGYVNVASRIMDRPEDGGFLLHQMSLSEAIGSVTVLTTIETGPTLWAGRDELGSRMDVVWLMPYDMSLEEDRLCFLKILRSISGRYTFDPVDLLARMMPDIAIGTATVMRHLVQLLDASKTCANVDGRIAIRSSDIEQSFKSKADIDSLRESVRNLRQAREENRKDYVRSLAAKEFAVT
jgi:histone H3/H4